MVSPCRKPSCISSCKKIKFIPYLFLKILLRYCKLTIFSTLRIPSQRLIQRILQSDCLSLFWPITWEPDFCQIKGLQQNINNNTVLHFFDYFQEKLKTKFFNKCKKHHFWPIWGQNRKTELSLKFCFYQLF